MAKKVNIPTDSGVTGEANEKRSDTKIRKARHVVREDIQTIVSSGDLSASVEIKNSDLVDEYLSFLGKLKQSKAQDLKVYPSRSAELEDHPERVTCDVGDLRNFFYRLDRDKFYGRNLHISPSVHEDVDENDPHFFGNHSAKFRNGIWGEFYATVDTCISEMGISEAEFKYMITKENFKNFESMNQGLIWLYLLLRKKGYSNRDLVG